MKETYVFQAPISAKYLTVHIAGVNAPFYGGTADLTLIDNFSLQSGVVGVNELEQGPRRKAEARWRVSRCETCGGTCSFLVAGLGLFWFRHRTPPCCSEVNAVTGQGRSGTAVSKTPTAVARLGGDGQSDRSKRA